MNHWIRNERLQMIAIAMATAIGAEFKINPFSGDDFRISLGVSIFLFLLLLMRHLSYIRTGIITGVVSVVVQSAEWMIQTNSFSVMAGLQNNVAAGFYYMMFAFGMSRIQHRINAFHPLLLGAVVSLIDFASNLTELFIRGVLLETYVFYVNNWFQLILIGVVRSYFVIGLFSSISISQMRALHIEQEKRMKQMLNIGAGLYGETFYLKKSMDTIEGITANSYELYRKLKAEKPDALSQQALRIAQQIHEVKKDSQRILAGLLKLYDSELVVDMSIKEILYFAIKANQEYSEMLKKNIVIEKEGAANFSTPHYIPLLTVLNNLMANAVEAIEESGTIKVKVSELDNEILIVVSDSGKGVPEQYIDLIFEPGLTTKFNDKGVAATGIGLSHVRDIVHSFGGNIDVVSAKESGSQFVVRLPRNGLMQGGSR